MWQLDAALAVDAVSVIIEALTSLVGRRRDVTRWSRTQQSRDCHVVDPIKPMLLGHVVNDHLRRVSRQIVTFYTDIERRRSIF